MLSRADGITSMIQCYYDTFMARDFLFNGGFSCRPWRASERGCARRADIFKSRITCGHMRRHAIGYPLAERPIAPCKIIPRRPIDTIDDAR